MRGTITTRHLLINAPIILFEFGVATYLSCIFAALLSRQPVTFLQVVVRVDAR